MKTPLYLVVTFILSFTYAQSEQGLDEQFMTTPCPKLLIQAETETETVVCHILNVPERHAEPDGASIELAVLTLKARTDNPEPDPIIFLQGGPGGAALSTVEFWADLSWRDTRDIILIDQRGTGYGDPNLKCPELYRNLDFEEAATDCRTRLSEAGYDLSAYNSREDAADISALLTALELTEGANLYGVSYGTRLALTVMRDAPQNVRTVVLDSTYPPQAERLMEFGANYERALKKVFSVCEADPECNETFPDLETTLYDALDDLERYGDTTLELSSQDVLNILFQAMYDESVVTSLPYAFRELERGNTDLFILILSGLATAEEVETQSFNVVSIWRGLSDVFKFIWREVQSEGVYFSTECPEDVLFQHHRKVQRAVRGLPTRLEQLALDTSLQMFAACRAWGSERGDVLESRAVISDIPTLVLGGSFDPITPPEWGQRAAQSLTNSHFFEFPNAAHGVFASGDCPVDMVNRFLGEPSVEPDSSCIAEIDFEFYVPERRED